MLIDDRNLIVHAYDEALARQIFGRLAAHAETLEAWLVALRSRGPHGR